MITTYKQFSELEQGAKISINEFHHIFSGGTSATIKDNSVNCKQFIKYTINTINYFDVKIGDYVNNGTRFIEITE